jgi:hypothetical protein
MTADFSAAQKEFLDRQSREKAAALSAKSRVGTQDKIDERQLRGMRTALSREAQKANIPSLDANMRRIERLVPVDSWKTGQPLPGFEGLDASVDPKKLTGKALELRQTVRGLQNELLKMQSGTAVTDSELNGLREQMGLAPVLGDNGAIINWTFRGFTKPEAVVNGIRNVKRKLESIDANLAAGFPEVYDDYKADYNSRMDKISKDPGGGMKTVSVDGVSYDVAKAEEIAKANPKHPKSKKILEAIKKARGE